MSLKFRTSQNFYRGLHASWILVITLAFVLAGSHAIAANGRVVVIDGVDPLSTATGSVLGDAATGYVFAAIDPAMNRNITNNIGEIKTFYWTNNAWDTGYAVESLTEMLKSEYAAAKASSSPLVILSHSWGTVLSYTVLKKNPEIVVDKFITMGSPLSVSPLVPGVSGIIGSFTTAKLAMQGIFQISALPNVRIWNNYWIDGDPVSASIPAVSEGNIEIQTTALNPLTNHSWYYQNSSAWYRILNEVQYTPSPLAIAHSPLFPTLPATVNFTATGPLADDVAASYMWDFGDSQSGTGRSVSHYYKSPGSYIVKLTLTDKYDEDHVADGAVYVVSPPIEVTCPEGFEDLSRRFETPANVGYKSYTWDFGDGVTRTDDINTTSYTYAASGYYTVKLTLTLNDDSPPITSEVGIFVGPGTRYTQGHTIYGRETWYSGGTYVVEGSIYIALGANLIVEPGVTVKMSRGASITASGTLEATGVKFTWADGVNEWNGIQFYGSGANGSRLENCVIEHAYGTRSVSDEDYKTAAVYILNASPSISGCTVRDSTASSGIYTRQQGAAVSPTITNTTVEGFNNGRYGLWVVGGASPSVSGSIFTGNGYGVFVDSASGGTYQRNTLSGNETGARVFYSSKNPEFSGNTYSGNTATDLYASGTITRAVVWDGSVNGAYRLGTIFIDPSASLTLATGSTVKVDNGATLVVSGTLKANGVKFTWADGVNEWNGIQFYGSGANGSRLENCVIEHAYGTHNVSDEGYKTAAVYILNSSPWISGCTVKNSTASSGIYARQLGAAASPTVTNTTVEGFDDGRYGLWVVGGASPSVSGSIFTGNGYGVYVDSASGGTYQGNTLFGNETGTRVFYSSQNPKFSGNTYSGNTATDLYASGTLTGAVVWDGSVNSAYRLGTIFIDPSASLTLATGSTVKVDNGATVVVSGTLKANGVKFTWADGVNEWNGIQFYGSGANGSRLENCVIEHTYGTHNVSDEGYKTAAVYILNSSPWISGCTVKDSTASSGIYARQLGAAVSPTISNMRVEGFDNGRYGLWVVGGASPKVSGSIFSGNGYGVFVDSASGGTYQGNTLSANTLYSLYHSGNTAIDAKNNNWGDPSGPLDDSDDRVTGGLYNPNGKGNKVSDNVSYYPWAGTTIPQPGTPTGLVGEGRYSSVNLKWNANTEASLSGYKLYYGTAPGSYGAPTIVDKITAHKITGLSNDTPYYLAISALNRIGAEGPPSSEIKVTPVNKFALDLTVSGSGKGSVLLSQGGTACNTNCSVLLDPFTVVSLQSSNEPFSLFGGWSGACTGSDGDCAIYLDGDKEVTARYDKDAERFARITLPTVKFYPTISAAYADSSAETVVETWGTEIVDALVLDKPIGLKIRGGFNEGYTASTGRTVLHGTIKVRRGKLSVERLSLRP